MLNDDNKTDNDYVVDRQQTMDIFVFRFDGGKAMRTISINISLVTHDIGQLYSLQVFCCLWKHFRWMLLLFKHLLCYLTPLFA